MTPSMPKTDFHSVIRCQTTASGVPNFPTMKVRTTRRGFCLLLMGFGVLAATVPQGRAEDPPAARTPAAILVTGYSLMPGWGLYPNTSPYGGTRPIGGASAMGTGQLTWIAEFAESGTHQVWVRAYGGYGSVGVAVNERRVEPGPPVGGRGYVWRHLGQIDIQAGTRHVDISASGMFDALLLTRDRGYHPQKDPLPEPVKDPRIRAPRRYRDDTPLRAAAGRHGFVVSRASLYDLSHANDVVPTAAHLIERLDVWGAPGEFVAGAFHVRALEALPTLRASLTELTGPAGARITPSRIDVRVVHLRERWVKLFGEAREPQHREVVPDMLVRDDLPGTPPPGHQGGYGGTSAVTSIPAHESRQFWITLDLAEDLPPGSYRGMVHIQVVGKPQRSFRLPLVLEVLAVPLKPVQGYYALYYPCQPSNKEHQYVSPERYLAELQDMVRHGCNAATLYGGVSTLEMARQAGMTEAPVIMGWGNDPAAEVAQAKALGFPDLYHYGVDEPNTPEQIKQIVTEAKRRLATGYHHMTAAINSPHAYEATKDFIDRPIYNSLVFGGKDNAQVKYVLDKGFIPVSYWLTRSSFPLYYRGMAGLWNTACGYRGTTPWAYQDSPAFGDVHAVVYPDEFGKPIPTLRWEAFREGIDDVRYLQALDRAIADAAERMATVPDGAGREALERALAGARDVRRTRYESIGGAWYAHLSAGLDEALDPGRREMADAVLTLRRALAATAWGTDR